MDRWTEAFALRPQMMPLRDALRLVGPTVVILVVLSLTGHFMLGLLIALGTYPVLFGAVPQRRHRLLVMTTAGAGLLLCVAVGMLAAGSLVATLLAYTVTTVLAALLDDMIGFGPPGAAFFVLMIGAGGIIGGIDVPWWQIFGPMAVGVVIAVIAAMAGPEREVPAATAERAPLAVRVRRRWSWPSDPMVRMIRVLVALWVLTLIGAAVGDPHPFWSVLVALLVLAYPGDHHAQIGRAVNRVLGTAAGIGVYWVWTVIDPPTAADVLAVGALMWAASRLAARNYLYASIVITLLALLMTQPLAAGAAPGSLALNRLGDTVLAGVVCLLLVLLVRPRRVTAV